MRREEGKGMERGVDEGGRHWKESGRWETTAIRTWSGGRVAHSEVG